MFKFVLLVALFFVCLNVVSCGNPTTVVVTKKRCYNESKNRLEFTIAAKLDIKNEGSQSIGQMKAISQGQEKKYVNYSNKAKTFGIYTSFANTDLTYTSHGRSQYIERPVKLVRCDAGKCFCNETTYYGYM